LELREKLQERIVEYQALMEASVSEVTSSFTAYHEQLQAHEEAIVAKLRSWYSKDLAKL
jgi:hypothetical protein